MFTGVYRTYYKDGPIEYEYFIDNGKIEGKCKKYYKFVKFLEIFQNSDE